MTVLLTLATANLRDTKIVLGEEGHLGRYLQFCLISLTSATLLPTIVAPSKQSTILSDTHSIVHAKIDLLDWTRDFSDVCWDGDVSGVCAELAATE